jgi:hypothetical protein
MLGVTLFGLLFISVFDADRDGASGFSYVNPNPNQTG